MTNMKLLLCILGAIAAAMADANDAQTFLTAGNNQFTARLFTEVLQQHPQESVVQSAFSVLTPLALLSQASVGESHDDLLKAIGLPNDNVTKEVFSMVNRNFRSIKGVELKMANKVYIPDGFKLNDQFAAVSKEVFDSEVQNIDFNKSAEAAGTINSWVEDHTNKRIKDVVDPNSLDDYTRAVLVNAIYFKGSWKDKFDKTSTYDGDFHVTNDKTIQVPFMFREADFLSGFSEELDAGLLSIPYEGDEASFLVVLPSTIDGLGVLTEKLKDPSLLENAIKNMSSGELSVHLPKFKIETKTNLKEALKNMNVNKLFDPAEARLANLIEGTTDLYISDAIQKAFIEVNEEGAEAAAGNDLFALENISVNPSFTVNRPFYYELRHNKTILFNGVFVQE